MLVALGVSSNEQPRTPSHAWHFEPAGAHAEETRRDTSARVQGRPAERSGRSLLAAHEPTSLRACDE